MPKDKIMKKYRSLDYYAFKSDLTDEEKDMNVLGNHSFEHKLLNGASEELVKNLKDNIQPGSLSNSNTLSIAGIKFAYEPQRAEFCIYRVQRITTKECGIFKEYNKDWGATVDFEYTPEGHVTLTDPEQLVRVPDLYGKEIKLDFEPFEDKDFEAAIKASNWQKNEIKCMYICDEQWNQKQQDRTELCFYKYILIHIRDSLGKVVVRGYNVIVVENEEGKRLCWYKPDEEVKKYVNPGVYVREINTPKIPEAPFSPNYYRPFFLW